MYNRWNFRHGAETNPRLTFTSHHQVSYSVNVWCGILNSRIIGPYFFEGNLTGQRNLHFLQTVLVDLPSDIPLRTRRRIYYQHDGCPAHNAAIVTTYLDRTFPGRWIGRSGPFPWPARSPDLTPLDYFLWGYLKHTMNAGFNDPVTSPDDLRRRITNACREINPASLSLACNETWRQRAEACIRVDGGVFEQHL